MTCRGVQAQKMNWQLRVLLLAALLAGNRARTLPLVEPGLVGPKHATVKFCIAPLPDKFHYDIGSRQLDGGANHFVRFESPFGELLSSNGAVWSTNQFCLDYWYFHQMTRWPHKVDCSKADVVYVPFISG